jgi:GNAT superfamily N-acetyltransferase
MLERVDAGGSPAPLLSPEKLQGLIQQGEALHRQLRPDLDDDYVGHLQRMFSEGARMTHLVDEGEVRALAVWRVFHTTYCGRRFEIEDLVTSSRHRSNGCGATLLRWLEDKARTLGCTLATLNSATGRRDAHRFYFRARYEIVGFHFTKDLQG